MFDLSGMRALLTGATSGLGAAIADAMEAHGAEVLRHGLERADPGYDVDLAQPGAAAQLAERALAAGPIDIVVLSASLQVRAGWDTLSADDVERQLRVNVMAGFELLQALVPGMQARGFGRVLSIGSVQLVRPHPDMVAYAASKAALASITRNLARQLAPSRCHRQHAVAGGRAHAAQRRCVGRRVVPAARGLGHPCRADRRARRRRRGSPAVVLARGRLHHRPGPACRRRDVAVSAVSGRQRPSASLTARAIRVTSWPRRSMSGSIR